MDIKRIPSIDIFRGIAVLQMIFWQIFDFFAKADIYADTPYYIEYFNMPINGIGVGLFTFISGACAYISVSKRLGRVEKWKTLLHAIKRYGGYIFISLFFTSFVFGFETFYAWNEAIQGIGLAALVCAILVMFVRSNSILLLIALLIIFLQAPIRSSLGDFSGNLLLNCAFTGFFSLSNLLPIALFGVISSGMLLRGGKSFVIKAFSVGLIIFAVSILMHVLGMEINYYGRSASHILFFIGICFILFGLIEFLVLKIRKSLAFDTLMIFGKGAIAAYIFHFVFIYKPLTVMGLESILPPGISFILSILSIIIIYWICILWLRRNRIVDKLLK